ncbi:MAG: mechanosensitive ion channel [Candidatus Gracilibacteria bacterium]|nr:mechanosensitive ion channel [Candidatus Gracilibacteria bacterium]
MNDKRRVDINIGVNHDTDIVKAKKVMLQVINNFPGILKTPESTVLITDIKESSINLNLRFWISSKGEYFTTKSNVTETINLAFK